MEKAELSQNALCCMEWEEVGLKRSGIVEGTKVRDIMLDTGCTRTMVQGDLVSKDKILEGKSAVVRCAHGDTVLYPLTQVCMEVDRCVINTVAAVSDTPLMAVLLGVDVSSLLLPRAPKAKTEVSDAYVTTRTGARRKAEKERRDSRKNELSRVRQSPAFAEQTWELGTELDDTIFQGGKHRPTQTRSQKRQDRREHRLKECPDPPIDSFPEISAEELKALQEADPTLEALRGMVRKEESEDEAGHPGKHKTTDRTLQRFYWPTVRRDIAEFCRRCETCQKSSKAKPQRAPLISLAIVDEPFKRIAMDIVGPLPRSRSGNRYVLVICDYATRYPEAVAMRTIEILTDQGSNFTSQLIAELYRLLHVRPIRTTPYHPQTDGLVERFNQTLKAMLQKAAVQEGKDWDLLIPYALFAYREVPQCSTGFSPFELLYGRDVRGPLDVLKESWEATEKSGESMVSHSLSLREDGKYVGTGAREFGKDTGDPKALDSSTQVARWAEDIEVDVQDEIPVWRELGSGTFSAEDIRFGEQLTAEQQGTLRALLGKFSSVETFHA
ncbi:hypothetical protein EMCRGX_G022205 [Ephydatia muelleri]